MEFRLRTSYKPSGDQPTAIKALVSGLKKGLSKQTLLGVTGSGKTFAIANVIEQIQKPTLVIAHNKTLAAQLAQEYREFFPENAVHYFVSYYDYYQPEAYMPISDTYIEKEAMINEEIERLRHATTQSLLTRKDVIVVASVSCIYGLGSPEEYEKVNLKLVKGDKISRAELIRKLVNIYFERTNADLEPGKIRAIGNAVEVMPVNEKTIYRFEFEEEVIGRIRQIDAISRSEIGELDSIFIFPAKHFVTPEAERARAIKDIKAELDARLKVMEKEGKVLEVERLKRRTKYDLAMIREIGYCNGIENYSRHFSGKKSGEAPDTLLSYFPSTTLGTGPNAKKVPEFLTIIDESHVTVPQLNGMYAGDASRKKTLVDFGFRLLSAKDNRPLKFDEFEKRVGQVIYTSATPGEYELEESKKACEQTCPVRNRSSEKTAVSCGVVEQVIRPTGLVDPIVDIKPVVSDKKYPGQVKDFIEEAEKTIKHGGRVIATTLTKKMAEDLSEFLKERGIKAEYLHSDIKTIDRIDILTQFRRGKFDCIVGVNLLREGLDLPEVELIGILDADKEGFLRSDTSLIQTIGRAARNVHGRVILYADVVTGSIKRALEETNRRRDIQIAYNKKHGITPQTIIKKIHDITEEMRSEHDKTVASMVEIDTKLFGLSTGGVQAGKNIKKLIKEKEKQMNDAVKVLDFESAALLRDEIETIKSRLSENGSVEPKKEGGRRQNKRK